MNTLYLDLFSGISGDMFLGAMIDLGVDPAALESALASLPVSGYHLHVRRGHKSAIEGVKVDVHLGDHHGHEHHQEHDHEHSHGHHHHDHGHPHTGHPHAHHDSHSHSHHEEHGRSYAEIKSLISNAQLSDWVKQKATAVFHRIAVAEGKIHGMPADQVHFHEVGAVDSIVDVVGAAIALEMLGKPRVLTSRVVEGFGWVTCAHGRFPIPAPATLAILGARGIAVSQCEEPHELITPTGAAIIAEFAESFGPMTDLIATRIGYGLGTRDNKTRPNVLRAILGTSSSATSALDWEQDHVTVLETNIDDSSAEVLGFVVEKALGAGALDAFHTPIQMKKSRPGVLLTLLCHEHHANPLTELVLRETSAFGVRRYTAERRKLKREFATVKTPFGEIPIKIGRLNSQVIQTAPEFEACRQAATDHRVPLKEVYASALKAFSELNE